MLAPERERDLAWLHLAVLVVAAVTVPTMRIGPAALLVVVGYSVALAGLAVWRRDPTLTRLWWFAATLSCWQVLPDLVLVELGVLTFPPDGVPDIGTVTLPMAGMWAIPTVLVVATAGHVRARRGAVAAVGAAAGIALLVYGIAEAVLPGLGVWEPVGVRTVGSVAPYVLLAEVVLGVVTWAVWQDARDRHPALTPVLTLGVTLAYTGAAVVSWLLLEA